MTKPPEKPQNMANSRTFATLNRAFWFEPRADAINCAAWAAVLGCGFPDRARKFSENFAVLPDLSSCCRRSLIPNALTRLIRCPSLDDPSLTSLGVKISEQFAAT